MNIIGVIPARYKSSRFPGKPLVDICGKPMIAHVYENASKVQKLSAVLVATDDKRIAQVCEDLNMRYIMTRDDHKTGTDRIAEVAQAHEGDLYVNIQGDEPMLQPEIIEAAINPFIEQAKASKSDNKQEFSITNLMTPIVNHAELIDIGVPKVVVNSARDAVYLSRLPIPYPKETRDITYFKQVCVYCFTKEALAQFAALPQGPSESAEGIELLRFIEHNIKVRMICVQSDTQAVDTPGDLKKVIELLSKKV